MAEWKGRERRKSKVMSIVAGLKQMCDDYANPTPNSVEEIRMAMEKRKILDDADGTMAVGIYIIVDWEEILALAEQGKLEKMP